MASAEFLSALDALQRGRVVAAATDTLVGLLVDASNAEALDRLSALKGRDSGQAFALIAPDFTHVSKLLRLSDEAEALATAHWPGALTIIAEARVALDERLLLHGKVGVRIPSPCDAHALCVELGGSVTATSANFAGQPAPSDTDAIDPKLRSAIESDGGVILRGRGPGGAASTLVDVTRGLRVLRAGPVTLPA